jgi:rod shape-determining protein MreD
LAALVAAVVLHRLGLWLYPSFPRALDLFLVVTILSALRGNSAAGMLVGLAAGLTADTLSGAPFGLFGFLNTLVGYSTARVCQRLVIQRPSQVFLVSVAAVVLQQALLAVLALLLLDTGALPELVWIPIKAVTCGAAAFLMVVLSGTLVREKERRRRGRMERLRL